MEKDWKSEDGMGGWGPRKLGSLSSYGVHYHDVLHYIVIAIASEWGEIKRKSKVICPPASQQRERGTRIKGGWQSLQVEEMDARHAEET